MKIKVIEGRTIDPDSVTVYNHVTAASLSKEGWTITQGKDHKFCSTLRQIELEVIEDNGQFQERGLLERLAPPPPKREIREKFTKLLFDAHKQLERAISSDTPSHYNVYQALLAVIEAQKLLEDK